MAVIFLFVLWLLFSGIPVCANPGFDEKYEPTATSSIRPISMRWNPLNPAQTYAPDNPFNPANRYDPGKPVNPTNRYAPNNPFNPANQYNPDNPLNPANRYNPTTPFQPLTPSGKNR